MKKISLISLIFITFFVKCEAYSRQLEIVATIRPIYALVKEVVGDVHNVKLLLQKGDSPHGYSLRPSDLKSICEADLVFLNDFKFENFIKKCSDEDKITARFIELSKAKGIEILKSREKHIWAANNAPHHHHHHGSIDYHLWLDIDNAKAMLIKIAAVLSSQDPSNSELYNKNALQFIEQLDSLNDSIMRDLTKFHHTPYVVFHDAYQYFENQYNLRPLGAITLHPDIEPGAKSLKELKNIIDKEKVACIFKEPQFSSKMVETIAKATNTKIGTLDPLWGDEEEGSNKNPYVSLLDTLRNNLVSCLSLSNDAAHN